MGEFIYTTGAVPLAGEEAGGGAPIVLLHGLTASRQFVVHGSHRLERSGYRVLAYDARGHGLSDPPPDPDAYDYSDLSDDLLAVLDEAGVQRALLAGASMGSHTAVRFALDRPERVAALALITPAYEPDSGYLHHAGRLERWDALSDGLRTGGVDGFLAAYGEPPVPDKWRAAARRILRLRLSQHRHPEAVADALRAVPRSQPFASWDELAGLRLPTLVVASRDEADPEHPFETGRRYAEAIPGARLASEREGDSPLAWQGARLSAEIAKLAQDAGLEPG